LAVSISTGTRASPGSADAPAHLQAVDAGQHEVENDQVDRRVLQHRQARLAVARVGQHVARPQVFAHHASQPGVVFDHQQAGVLIK
jgi:hypothetical protein